MATKKCVLCGCRFEGDGYDPWPVMKGGECCRKCNNEIVLPFIKHSECHPAIGLEKYLPMR